MKSFCSILEEAASEVPDKPLFIFPETRWNDTETLSYGELASRVAAAGRRIEDDTRPGDRALLLFPTGAAFWEACLGSLAAGVIAVPLKVPNLNRTSDHLQRVCSDCTPSVLLTDDETAGLLRRRADKHPFLQHLPVLTPDGWRGGPSKLVGLRQSGEAIAFLQYTSGSTSHPKGVQVSHQNLIANAEMIRDWMGIRTDEDRSVTWLPHYHDMGFVGTYLETLFTRNTAWCLPPEEFALHPERWLRLISEHKATICGGPDFAYRTCVERIADEQLDGVDLSSWRVAFNGAERIRPETLRRFTARFSPYGFRERAFFPCYGLGEATLMASGGPPETGPTIRRVSASALLNSQIAPPASETDCTELASSGQTYARCPIVILDLETGRPAAEDQIGQVLVAGPSVTRGYFNRTDLNDGLFLDVMVERETVRFLKTGDLGFLSRGELFVTGRLHEMMIVRGRNLYPEDVEERTWQAHEALAPGGAVAFSVDADGQESLVIAAEVRRTAVRMACHEDVVASVRHRVIEAFGVTPMEILLLRPASIPRTSSGKSRRSAVRTSYTAGTLASLFREQS